MPGDFAEGIDELQRRVGVGSLVGKVEVDQVYAHYQHEDLSLKHRDGGPKYLQAPLLEFMHDYMSRLAESVLDYQGPEYGMRQVVEHLSEQVTIRAPLLYGNLRTSGHPTVEDDGAVVYDRPPISHRLTEEEIKHLFHANLLGH